MFPAIPTTPPHRPLIYMLASPRALWHRNRVALRQAEGAKPYHPIAPLFICSVLQAYLDGSSVCLEPFGTGEASRNRSDFGEATW